MNWDVENCREAFSGFDAEIVGNLTEKQIASISAHYAIDISRVRAVVDNANGILQVTSLSFLIESNSH